jgi:hypothetical protein
MDVNSIIIYRVRTDPEEVSKNENIRTKRIYEKPYEQDSYRIIVDRIWPRLTYLQVFLI